MAETQRNLGIGDLVTLNLGKYNNASNTYIIEAVIGDKYFLKHPLMPNFFIMKGFNELNNDLAMLKSELEKCLFFCHKHRNYLDFESKGTLDSISLHFVTKRYLTTTQKKDLTHLCGTISAILTNHDIAQAAKIVVENEALLDDFHKTWYNNLKGCFDDTTQATNSYKKTTIYRIAGFILSQLEIN